MAEKQRGKMLHVHVPHSEDRVLNYFGATPETLPMVVIADMSSDNAIKKFKCVLFPSVIHPCFTLFFCSIFVVFLLVFGYACGKNVLATSPHVPKRWAVRRLELLARSSPLWCSLTYLYTRALFRAINEGLICVCDVGLRLARGSAFGATVLGLDQSSRLSVVLIVAASSGGHEAHGCV